MKSSMPGCKFEEAAIDFEVAYEMNRSPLVAKLCEPINQYQLFNAKD